MNQTTASPVRRIALLATLGLSLSLISPVDGALRTGAPAVAATTATATTLATAADAPNPAHPFSDPIWSPLRTPARTSCVYNNCPGPYHGHWAIDFIDTDHSTFDPIYAAGAGILHIGAVIGKDTCSSGRANSGSWVWIDHGGGRNTRYTHLYSVLAKEGQLVTPATMIGRMGHNGNRAPCTTNYLHMETHANGQYGPFVAPGAMFACTSNGRISMPSQGLGRSYSSWNDVPISQSSLHGPLTPAATNSCLAASRGAATPNRPTVSYRRGSSSATIGWGVVPTNVNRTIVTIETWHPSLGRYGSLVYRTVAKTASSTRFTGLLNGRPYRLRATTHNGAGYSAWSAYVRVVPGAVPSRPRAPRLLSTSRDTIRYAWWLPNDNGRAITRHVVARRCVVGAAWTQWAKTNVPAPRPGRSWTLNYNWRGLSRGRTCQVMVQAVNSVGAGGWSAVSRATTLR